MLVHELDTQPGLLARISTGYTNLKLIGVQLLRVFNSLGNSFRGSAESSEALAASTDKLTDGLKDQKVEVAQTAAQLELMSKASDLATDAVTKLGTALGEATSIDLNNQIFEIVTNLELAKEKLGSNSDEFVRLESIAGEKINALRARIDSLRSGMGDLNDTTERTAGTFGLLGDSFEGGEQRAEGLSSAVDVLRGRLDDSARAAQRLNAETGGSLSGLRARTSSNQARVDAALARGIRPSQGGTRIRTLDGGSVLLEVTG